MATYLKKPITVEEQVNVLEEKGLTLSDKKKAAFILSTIGYYRFSGYAYPFRNPLDNSSFVDEVSFEDIYSVYCFDRRLRVLLFDYIERIEITFRTQIINQFSLKTSDPFWYVSNSSFCDDEFYEEFIEKLKEELTKSSEDFMAHFDATYDNDYPPCWMGLQIMSFGSLVNLYRNSVLSDVQDNIARFFGCESTSRFISWLNTIVYFRNICGHHARLWNRKIMKRPESYNFGYRGERFDNRTLYYSICILKSFLDNIHPNNKFKEELVKLFLKYSYINNTKNKYMGFPKDWEKQIFWKD